MVYTLSHFENTNNPHTKKGRIMSKKTYKPKTKKYTFIKYLDKPWHYGGHGWVFRHYAKPYEVEHVQIEGPIFKKWEDTEIWLNEQERILNS